MRYVITDYSREQAKKLGVEIKPSKDPDKKIDVFRNGRKIATIGAKGYLDYPTYMKLKKGAKFQRVMPTNDVVYIRYVTLTILEFKTKMVTLQTKFFGDG